MWSLSVGALLFLVSAKATQSLGVVILADTNRDGFVDDLDYEGRAIWNDGRGALFLANIGDTGQRCSSQLRYPNWNTTSSLEEIMAKEKELDLCNDASGTIQRNPKYLAPVKVLPIDSYELPEDAMGTLTVTGDLAASMTRIFVKKSGNEDWTFVHAAQKFEASELKQGFELGIDARDVRRPGSDGWDGYATIVFSVLSQKREIASDSVVLRVAPVLTHHQVQKAMRTFVSNGPGNEPGKPDALWGSRSAVQSQFANVFTQHSAEAGIKDPTFRFYKAGDAWNMVGDPWPQDLFEPAFTSIPGPHGPIVLRIMIRSTQSYRATGREVFHRLRSESVGAVQTLGLGGTHDSLGNLETIPPHEHDGRSYPAGRIMMGSTESTEPLILDFLRAQEVQDPIKLDVSWLEVGHVDEFLQFLPANNTRGWVLMVYDPLAGLDIIKAAAAEDPSAPALSRPAHAYDPRECRYNETLDDLLAFPFLSELQKHAAERIQLNLDILKREIGLRDTDVYSVPGLYANNVTGAWKCPMVDGSSLGNGNESLDDETPPPIEEVVGQEVCSSDSSLREGQANQGFPMDMLPFTFGAFAPGISQPNNFADTCQVTDTDNTAETRSTFDHTAVPLSFALYPNAINSVVLSDKLVLAAKQWGPVVNGVDVLEVAVREAYAKVGFNVKFQDDWFSHHEAKGNVRCGTNVWREADVEWWKS